MHRQRRRARLRRLAEFTPAAPSPPFITGTPKLGGTLTCTGTGTFTWSRGPDGPTHVVALEDLGHPLTCTATTGGTSAAVTPGVPVNTSPPEIRGTPHVGRTLTCATGAWDGDYPLTIAWSSGESTPTHVVSAADQALSCTITAADTGATSAQVTPTAPRNLVAPAITGEPRVGGTLTCGSGDWDDAYPISQRWLRDGNVVATGATYVPGAVGALHCEASAGGAYVASQELTVNPPASRTAPVIDGTPRVGGALTCTPGNWDATYGYSYAWELDGAPAGSGAGYVPTAPGDVTCVVTAAGLTAATSAPVTVNPPRSLTEPAIGGDPRIGNTLTCTPGSWDATYSYSYAWTRDDDPLATGATHTVTGDDLGSALSCEVTAAGLSTAAGAPVFPAGPQSLTPPAIGGDPVLRGTLTCSSGNWDGTYALTYQWLRDGQPIDDATGTAYGPLTPGDVHSQFTCAVTAEGMEEADSSPADVEGPTALGGPHIEGPANPGRAITCDPGRWNDRDGLRYRLTYRWYHEVEGLRAIPGADQASYVVSSSDVGYQMVCIVTAEEEVEERSELVRAGWQDLAVYVTADNDAPDPGAANGYTITLRNLNPTAFSETEIDATLPAGFTYTPGLDDRRDHRQPGDQRPRTEMDEPLHGPPNGESSCTSRHRRERARRLLRRRLRLLRQLLRLLRAGRLPVGARPRGHAGDVHDHRHARQRRAQRHVGRRRHLRPRRRRPPLRSAAATTRCSAAPATTCSTAARAPTCCAAAAGWTPSPTPTARRR